MVIVSGEPVPPAQHGGGEVPATVAASDGAARPGVAAPIERVEEVAASAEQPRSGAEPRSARLSVLAEPTPKELRATLSRLGLVGCCGSLCGVGVQAALAQLRHARELNGSFRLRSEGDVRVVAYLLRHVCSSLVTLDLAHCDIGDEGAKALAAGVAASGSLALKKLVVPDGMEKHAQLVAACKSKGVTGHKPGPAMKNH